MKNGKVKLAMVLVFLSGIVIGAVGGLVALRTVHQRWVRAEPKEKVQIVVKRLERRLDLREEQLPAVQKSIEKGLFKMGVLQVYAGKGVLKILDETVVDMTTSLDAEQEAELENMMEMLWEHVRKQSPLTAEMLEKSDLRPANIEK